MSERCKHWPQGVPPQWAGGCNNCAAESDARANGGAARPCMSRDELAAALQSIMWRCNTNPAERVREWADVPEFERDDYRAQADYVLGLLAQGGAK